MTGRKVVLCSCLMLLGALLLTTDARAFGCVTKGGDTPGGCGDSDCDSVCASRPPLGGDLHLLFPGFFTEQVGGKIMVASIVPGSPAEEAGLRRGDELVAVDGLAVPLLGEASHTWQRTTSHMLAIRRGSQVLTKEVTTLPAQVMFARAVRARNVIQSVSQRSHVKSEIPNAPYLSGLVLRQQDSEIIVVDVLPGTSADAFGIRSGDKIVSVNGKSIQEGGLDCLAALQGADHRAEIKILVRRAGQDYAFRLGMVSVSEILRNLAEEASLPRVQARAGL